MNMRKLIRNAQAIVSCDEKDTVYKDSDLLIEDQKIIEIGENLSSEGVNEIIDGKNKFIYPGLVNTHHHFFQTFIRNTIKVDYPNMTVPEWLDKIYPVFKLVNNDVIYYSSLTAMADLLKHGCTTAFDHQYCYTKKTGIEPVDRQMEAAQLLGIRYTAGRGTNTLPRSEGSTMPEEMLETTDAFINDCQRLIEKYHDPNSFSKSQIVVAPCQPLNCYKDTFVESVKLARSHNVHLHTHLGEGENEVILRRWGMRSLNWCEEIDFIGEDVWFAHGWEMTNEELDRLAKYKTGVSHCPAPAVLGGFPILDFNTFKEKGVLLSLGCDGSATNDSSNLLDSLRMAYLMQAFHSKQRGGCITPYELLKIATINGAKTLGRDDIGSLEIGKAADLFMIDTTNLELTGTWHDPANLLARGGVTGPTWLTMVGGNVVSREGRLVGIDEEKLSHEGEQVCTDVLRNCCNAF
ncbi:amidohydrolase [Faecalicatena contorta]|uniref:Hydroxyatrazine ethylaminohydrolase n=1 Tax=Faecalicatena contorta TaxID=39482 RepID=A0A316A001_9FIRM|nr:hydroxyatrazine ethylaminohydrolase [Faecalicatena contorta]SUQ13427.1 hydroxyatrazine ethylaminohydrolase [Faecalicatena contorta]